MSKDDDYQKCLSKSDKFIKKFRGYSKKFDRISQPIISTKRMKYLVYF